MNTTTQAHLAKNDEIRLVRFESNEQYFINEPYTVLHIGDLVIFPTSTAQLIQIAEAIHEHVADIENGVVEEVSSGN
jgi:Trk K+ transport system NAD-binding subunit